MELSERRVHVVVRIALLRLTFIDLIQHGLCEDGKHHARRRRHAWGIFVLVSKHGTRVQRQQGQIPFLEEHVYFRQSSPGSEFTGSSGDAALSTFQRQFTFTLAQAEGSLAIKKSVVHWHVLQGIVHQADGLHLLVGCDQDPGQK